MQISVVQASLQSDATDCLVLFAFEDAKLTKSAESINKASKKALANQLRTAGFHGKSGENCMLLHLPGVKAERVLVVGLGARDECRIAQLQQAAQASVNRMTSAQVKDALFALPAEVLHPVGNSVRELVQAACNATYSFSSCKSKADKASSLRKMRFAVSENLQLGAARTAARQGQAIAEAMHLAKDLANLPGNICTPSYLAKQASSLGRKFKTVSTSILSEADMAKLKMGALLSVSRGSRQPAKLIVMEYKGAPKSKRPIALVGKGLTFDAGGISIKPAANMDEMKYDMCGGASVIGAIQAIADMHLPINVVGIVPASENLPDGDANKPGDIVTSMSGQTIEILNTDAEGRLILCDALTYAKKFNPEYVIDIATLTGACIVALGHHASALMANDERIAADLLKASENCNDRVWRLPLWDDYQSQLDSNFADMANIGGPPAGSITAACFLSRYTKDMQWAHLDIAGTAWKSGKDKGATGRPVPLLVNYLIKQAERVQD